MTLLELNIGYAMLQSKDSYRTEYLIDSHANVA